MSNPLGFERLRPLGLLEKLSSARHSLGFYHNVALSAHYSKSGYGGSLPALVYRTLAAVIAQHPILSAIPVDEDKSDTFFVRLPEIDLRHAVTFVTRKTNVQEDDEFIDRELDEIVEEQHNTNFKEKYGQLPFWRVIVLHPAGSISKFVVCFIFHHSLGDGGSGLAFHRSFFSALNAKSELQDASEVASDPESVDPVVYTPSTPLLPSLEDVLPLPLSITFFVKTLWSEFIARAPQNVWTASPITASASLRTRFQSFSLSLNTTQRLLIASRSNSTTLTATAETLLAATLFEHLPPEKYSRLAAIVAISMRRFMPTETIDNDSMGTYVSACKYMHLRPTNGLDPSPDSRSGPFSWYEARKVKSVIEAELDKKSKDSVVGLLRYIGDILAYLNNKIGRERDQSFEVSNIGLFKTVPMDRGEDVWKVGKIIFSQSSNIVGPALEASLVTGGDGCLTIGFSWLEGIVDGEWVETVMKSLKMRMENLSR